MLSSQLLALVLALAPSLISAAIFPPDSLVKTIDAKGFKKAMEANETSMVAFVAPWCGHCQKMAPDYSKAALGLYPLVPAYAVDCDAEKNKRLCAEQGVQGFPTIKLFPRGKTLPSKVYEIERSASGFWYFATRGIPQVYEKLYYDHDISPWVEKHKNKHRALLLRKDKKTPLTWQILANKYHGQLEFGAHRDRKGRTSVIMGLEREAGDHVESKVLLYPAGSTTYVRYQGIQKLESLSKFLDSVLDGTADLSSIIEETKAEEFIVDEEELEIERKQEAQRIALLHGGFTDLIDFEKALKDGAGAGFHDSHGYAGAMGGVPEHLKKKKKPSDAGITSSDITPSATAMTTASATTSTMAGSTSLEVTGRTPIALPSQKKDEAAKESITASESIKAPEPVVEDKKQDAKDIPTEEETISDQVVLEIAKNRDAEASPAGCQCQGSCGCKNRGAESTGCQCTKSALAGQGASCGCKASAERPKDEL